MNVMMMTMMMIEIDLQITKHCVNKKSWKRFNSFSEGWFNS